MHRIAAALLALALAAAACSDSSDEPGGGGASPTTVAVADGTTATGGDGSPTTGGDVLDPSAPPAAAGTVPEPDDSAFTEEQTWAGLPANAFGAPRPGDYEYRISAGGDQALLRIADLAEEGAAFDRTGDLRQVTAFVREKESVEQSTWWRAAGWMLRGERRNAQGDETPVCDYEPDLVLLPRPLSPGTTWSSEGSCQVQDFTRTRTITGEVTGTETITVAGASYEALVVHRVIDTATGGPGVSLGERVDATEWWVPDLGLFGRRTGTIADTVQGVARDPRSFEELLLSTPGTRGA